MVRTKPDPSMKSRDSRAKLPKRHTPYWLVLEKGRALGYRKGEKGGNWLAKYYDPLANPTRLQVKLGPADDDSEPDGKMVLSFAQAQAAAREWFKDAFHKATGERIRTGPYTVANAVDDYLEDRKKHGVKTATRMRWDFDARVIPALGDIQASKLTKRRLEDWLEEVAASPVRHRRKVGKAPETEDELRARKASANRLWKNLKAALNLAVRDRKVQSDAGWKEVKPFRGTHAPRIRFLNVTEQQRLVNSCPTPDFRRLIQAGLFTGARESELTRLRSCDFDETSGSVFIEFSKSGKQRYITLTPEGTTFFCEMVAGLQPDALIFPRTSYDRTDKRNLGGWSRAELSRMMAKVCKDAGIEPMVFHELRHTYASGWINKGLALIFVAQQLGHRDTRMVEDHYGHLCQSAKADAVRKLAPVLGIHQPLEVAALKVGGGA